MASFTQSASSLVSRVAHGLNFVCSLLAVLGLRCRARAFSSCGAGASHRGGPSCCGAWALGAQASVLVGHGLSYPSAGGIFPDQGSNPCVLHRQADP